MAGNNSVACRSVACRSDLPLSAQRRPIFLLVKWVNALIQQRPRTPEDLHLTFADGHTLCLLLQRLRPGTRLCKFSRAVTRATAMGNIEQALALVWNHLPTPSAMPSAAQILDGSPREINLRFVDQLYSIFVVRPARARLTAASSRASSAVVGALASGSLSAGSRNKLELPEAHWTHSPSTRRPKPGLKRRRMR